MTSRWPRDDQNELIAFYGNPGSRGPDSVAAQLVPVIPPFKMYYEGKSVAHLMFHRKAAPALLAALNEIWEHVGKDQAKLDALHISRTAGTYNPRKVRGSDTKWSNHAFGAAIDLDAEENGMYADNSHMPSFVVDAFKRQGFRWGGDYHHRKDPMHFEACDSGEQHNVVTPRVTPRVTNPVTPGVTKKTSENIDNEFDAAAARAEAEDAMGPK